MSASKTLASDAPTRATHLREPIAIVGIGCRFPGASGPEAFWKLLCEGRDAIKEVPASRWDAERFYDSEPNAPGKTNTRWGGFLDRVDEFDAQFFGITPREAARMDPQQRLLLEVTEESLEDAGQAADALAGSATGVFVGISTNEYSWLQLADLSRIDAYSGTGNALSIAANRISYAYDFRGPSVAIDTACSSSLVAIHFACRSLNEGECSLAVAGGVNVVLSPAGAINFAKAGAMAPDGRCKPFDARANGYVRSEGAGAVVLKPLSAAVADGDPIYAVIRGSAVNQDGRSNGIMAPSRWSQEAVLRDAYRCAGVVPGDVQYVEAHGSGTQLGDPIEAHALGAVLRDGRHNGDRCAVGSVKSNIGHLEAAAGVAGLIKTALALHHRTIPATLHFGEPNPHIPLAELPLRIQDKLTPWPEQNTPAIAGVSSFGFGGTNAHVVLQEAPPRQVAHDDNPAGMQLLPISARSPEALRVLADAWRGYLVTTDARLVDACHTAGVRRSHHDHRLAVVGSSHCEMSDQLEAFVAGRSTARIAVGRRLPSRRRKIAFVFPGQGPEWSLRRMLLEREPAFRDALERCHAAFSRHVPWSLFDELFTDESSNRLGEADVGQPALFAVQVALAELWRSWGIEPDAVIGHSLGEVAAAHVAGVLTLDDAVQVAVHRGHLIRGVSGQGRMAMVELPLADAHEVIAGREHLISVAAQNGPKSIILSGQPDALQSLVDELGRRGIFARLLPWVDFASHSPQMEPLQGDLERLLAGLRAERGTIPVYSTVTGRPEDGAAFDAKYWGRNLREPVLFATAVETLAEAGHDLFVELSPQPALHTAISDILRARRCEGIAVGSLRRGEEPHGPLYRSLATLYAAGAPVAWRAVHREGQFRSVPSYPWQHERCWLEPGAASPPRASASTGGLLGRCAEVADAPGRHIVELTADLGLLPFVSDHRLHGVVVVPASAFCESALAAAREILGPGTYALSDVAFEQALQLRAEASRQVQLVLTAEGSREATFGIYSRPSDIKDGGVSWTRHASGRISCEEPSEAQERIPLQEVRSRCSIELSAQEHYARLRARGLEYGPSLRGLETLWRHDGEAIGRLRLPENTGEDAFVIHPAILDAGLHVLGAAVPEESDGALYVPVHVDRLQVRGRPAAAAWSHACLKPASDTSTLDADVSLLDENGVPVIQVSGLRLRRVGSAGHQARARSLAGWAYEVKWETKAKAEGWYAWQAPRPPRPGAWLIFADQGGVGRAIASLLSEWGEHCVLVWADDRDERIDDMQFGMRPERSESMQEVIAVALASPEVPPLRGVIHLWNLDAPPTEQLDAGSLDAGLHLGCTSVVHLVQALVRRVPSEAPRLWLVTRGAQAACEEESVAVAQAPAWGLGRTIALEHPELWCARVDLDGVGDPAEVRALFEELWSEDFEDQVAFRAGMRRVPRLIRSADMPSSGALQVPPSEAFQLQVETPGTLDGLALKAAGRPAPGAGEVEIEVGAAGLNFMDVMSAMGMLADAPSVLGAECAGRIVRVGPDVTRLHVGDEVMAVASGAAARFVLADARLVVPRPAGLTLEQAATTPIAFLTAHYALDRLARLRGGERVLIHAAAGGVGLAAVQLAKRAGAEIFATAGSDEKRQLLASLGIRYVFSSRSVEFAGEVLRATGGRGVDVVLNSLSGEFIDRGLEVLGSYGRFVELGKTDIHRNGAVSLRPFQKNLSFFAVDLARMCRERPEFVGALLLEIAAGFEDGSLSSLPVRTFPVTQANNACRHMAQRLNVGKVALLLAAGEVRRGMVRSSGTYLITGGTGALGLTCARWLVERGARHIVLVARREPTERIERALAEMRAAGAVVIVAQADVAREEALGSVAATLADLPPLRGVVHAAGVLDDCIVLDLDVRRLEAVMAPKLRGAWNLHALTRGAPLDFFVLFSSLASVLGSPGQANYAAANAFLDALAHERRAHGLAGVSINWGPWAEVGLAAQPSRGGRLALRGIESIAPHDGIEMLSRVLRGDLAQVSVAPIDWKRWRQLYPVASELPLLTYVVNEEAVGLPKTARPSEAVSVDRDAILAAAPDARAALLETYLREQVAWVCGFSSPELDVEQPLTSFGLESLMAVELRNQVEAELDVSLSMIELLEGPSIRQLAIRLLEQLPDATDLAMPIPPGEGKHWEELTL